MAPRYNDDDLAFDLADGRLSFEEIGQRYGLSARYVRMIDQGKARPSLQARIDAASRGLQRRSRRLGTSLSRAAWTTLVHLATDAEAVCDETRRKASVDILKLAGGDIGETAGSAAPAGPNLTDLSDETKARIVAELDGPTDEP